MFYLENQYSSYKYVVEYSDNFLVLSNQRRVQGTYEDPESINVLVKYFQPSDFSFMTSKIFYNYQTFDTISTSDDDMDRADIPQVIQTAFIIVLLTIFIYHIVSRIFVRGGILR